MAAKEMELVMDMSVVTGKGWGQRVWSELEW